MTGAESVARASQGSCANRAGNPYLAVTSATSAVKPGIGRAQTFTWRKKPCVYAMQTFDRRFQKLKLTTN